MTQTSMTESRHGRTRLRLNRLRPDRPITGLAQDVRSGLLHAPRRLAPKYFYDTRGSLLFDRICSTPEYYLTRSEAALLERHAAEIIHRTLPDAIVEFGSGTASKTEMLIHPAGMQRHALHYLPVDVCETVLLDAGQRLEERYPWLHIDAWHGDFMHGLSHFANPHPNTLYAFLGSSIGNLSRTEAITFLREVRGLMSDGDALLLGADLVKDHDVLHAAYNDADGYTAAFNLNVLEVINDALQADFDTAGFAHEAIYDADASRIEMRLVASHQQRVRIADLDLELDFAAGEHIVTEYSRKYTHASITDLLRAAGFATERFYGTDDGYFMLVLARPGG